MNIRVNTGKQIKFSTLYIHRRRFIYNAVSLEKNPSFLSGTRRKSDCSIYSLIKFYRIQYQKLTAS